MNSKLCSKNLIQPSKANQLLNNISCLKAAKYYVNFAVFLFLALSVSFKGSYAISGAFIVSTYLLLFFADIRAKISLSKAEKWLIVVLLCYLASAVLEILIHDVPISKIDPQSKILVFIPFIFILNSIRVTPLVVFLGIAAGCMGLFGLAVFEKYYLGYQRVGTFINAIQLGNIASVFGMMSILLAPVYFKHKGKWAITSLLLLAGVLGLCASVFTQTRGGLLFLPVLFVISVYYYRNELKAYKAKTLIASLIVLPIVAVAIANTSLINRLEMAIIKTQSYFTEGEASSSAGVRLELWKAASIITMNNPLLGVGITANMQEKKKLVDMGKVDQSILIFKHAHNAYFDISARRGILGLAFLLALLIFPVYAGHRYYKKGEKSTKGLAISIVMFGLFFICANLTQVLFSHNSGMIFYTGMLIILIACINSIEKRPEFRLNKTQS